MSLEAEKRQLRHRLASLRAEVDPIQAERAGVAIAQLISGLSAYAGAEWVALYAATDGEVPTQSLFESARADGKRCLFPRCLDARHLEFAEVEAWRDLTPGRFGILEPPPGAKVQKTGEIDLVAVPGVGFDLHGGRLGRGGGYYDLAFSQQSAAKAYLIGVGHSFQLIDSVPVGGHDRHMNAIVTELGAHEIV